MRFTREQIEFVKNDENTEYIKICTDPYGCVEVRSLNEEGHMMGMITMPPEEALLVARSIINIANQLVLNK